MQTPQDLTDTQRAVIAHDDGPAVVVAGAGTGKTTVLARRAQRLVKEGRASPNEILVTSFGRDTVDDLQSALASLHVPGIQTRTLHALGLRILRADSHTTSHPQAGNSDLSPAVQARRLARHSLRDVARRQGIDASDLGYSPSELADRIAMWKQSLTYHPESLADLPPAVREHARECDPDSEDLLALFRRFEDLRRERGWCTYSDMVRSGWERLITDSSLRETLQARHRYVLVDEFQDLSRAQVRMLDLLTAAHRNYMVVGDEDQCIYGWRGADPSALLSFRDRHYAAEYRMTTSFRSPASALVLANGVITQNDNRRPTRLRCARGPVGQTELRRPADTSDEATIIADRIETLHAEGMELRDIAVLVRTYGQTPPLERAFLEHDLPYRLTGAAPFYTRPAVRTLLQYLYWALLERRRQEEGWFSSDTEAARYADRFTQILKRPTRYIPHRRIRRMGREIQRERIPAIECLRAHQPALSDPTAERADAFIDTIEGLLDRGGAPPQSTLEWLVNTLDYNTHLRETSAYPRLADARIRAVDGLTKYAQHYESSRALLNDIRTHAAQQQRLEADAPAIDVRSIHRAKGREWPAVILPGCVDGTLPLSSESGLSPPMEEERRLLYVALTRARQHLVISSPADRDRSPFLTDASAENILTAVEAVRSGLTAPPDSLSDRDLVRLCHNVEALSLTSYIKRWWSPSTGRRAAMQDRLDQLSASVAAARRRQQAYRQRRAEWGAHHQARVARARERLRTCRDRIGTAPIAATAEEAASDVPREARLRFECNESDSEVSLRWNDHRVGYLAPLASHRLEAETVLSLPWFLLDGVVERIQPARQTLTIRIDWETSIRGLEERLDPPAPPPDPPSDQTRALCDDQFRTGYNVLRDALRASS